MFKALLKGFGVIIVGSAFAFILLLISGGWAFTLVWLLIPIIGWFAIKVFITEYRKSHNHNQVILKEIKTTTFILGIGVTLVAVYLVFVYYDMAKYFY